MGRQRKAIKVGAEDAIAHEPVDQERTRATNAVSREPIPPEILAEMVLECAGNSEKIYSEVAKYIQENKTQILRARFSAELGLAKNHGLRDVIKEHREQALSDVNKILGSATKLKNLLSEIPDLAETPAPLLSGLPMRLQSYMYTVEDREADKKRIEQYGCGESEEKLSKWFDFLDLLEQNISVLTGIKSDLDAQKKRGRPDTLKELTGFIYEIAKMYMAVTGKKFTVCQYGDKDYMTAGMRFAQKAMAAIYIPSPHNHKNYKKWLETARYSDESFFNACSYAASRINSG